MVAATAETPSFSVKPRATAMAKMSAMLPKTTSPEFFISSDSTWGSQGKFAAPMPSSRPATGRTATGSMRDLPTFCRKANASVSSPVRPAVAAPAVVMRSPAWP